MTAPARGQVRAWTLGLVALRSFLLQATWNYQRLQNLGFAFAIKPVLFALYPSRDARAKAIRRHLEFFVTHPYCAALILGVVARLEEDAAAHAATGEASEPNRVKTGMMGPLAALGDTMFWATIKPLTALIGTTLVWLAVSGGWSWWIGPAVFLGLYTAAQMPLRLGGVFAGYARSVDIIKDLQVVNPRRVAQKLTVFMAVAAGAAGGLVFSLPTLPGTGSPLGNAGVLSGFAVLFAFGLRQGLSSGRMFYLLVAAAVMAGYAGLR